MVTPATHHTRVNTYTHTHTAGPELARRLPGYRWPGDIVHQSQQEMWSVEEKASRLKPGSTADEIKRFLASYPPRKEALLYLWGPRFRLHVFGSESVDAARSALPTAALLF